MINPNNGPMSNVSCKERKKEKTDLSSVKNTVFKSNSCSHHGQMSKRYPQD